jgi:DNA repair exonuclease SbcCD nuclease subunit
MEIDMKTIKFAKISDTHIGQKRREATRKTMQWLAEDINAQGCHAVLHHGDFFEDTATEYDMLVATEFVRSLNCPLYILKGNHGNDEALRVLETCVTGSGEAVTAIYKPDIITVHGVTVYCMPHLDKANLQQAQEFTGIKESQVEFNNLVAQIFQWFAAHSAKTQGVKTFMGHFNVPGCTVSTGQVMNDPGLNHGFNVPLSCLTELKVQDIAVGHIHKRQVLTKKPHPVYYIGDPTRKNYGETEAKGYHIATYEIADSEAGITTTVEFRVNPFAPVLVTEEWAWDTEANDWDFRGEDEADIAMAEVRVIASYSEGSKPDWIGLEAIYKDNCKLYTIERRVVTVAKTRAATIVQAVTPQDKLRGFWEHTQAPDAETQVRVLQKLEESYERVCS